LDPTIRARDNWAPGRRLRTAPAFNAALNDSLAMWAAVKSDNQAEVMAEAQGFNIAAASTLHDSRRSCADPGGNYMVAIYSLG
jgi:hypothetical protein